MSGVYKIGFRSGETTVAEAKGQALATIRADGDEDEVTAGPDVIATDEHDEAGEFLIRIVTGIPDPLAARPRDMADPAALADPVHEVLGRMAALPPGKLAELNALLDRIEP